MGVFKVLWRHGYPWDIMQVLSSCDLSWKSDVWKVVNRLSMRWCFKASGHLGGILLTWVSVTGIVKTFESTRRHHHLRSLCWTKSWTFLVLNQVLVSLFQSKVSYCFLGGSSLSNLEVLKWERNNLFFLLFFFVVVGGTNFNQLDDQFLCQFSPCNNNNNDDWTLIFLFLFRIIFLSLQIKYRQKKKIPMN